MHNQIDSSIYITKMYLFVRIGAFKSVCHCL
nr:MAG TPA: hypothetical protein [Bacteriophage sp.]